jgi:hypothetical protein
LKHKPEKGLLMESIIIGLRWCFVFVRGKIGIVETRACAEVQVDLYVFLDSKREILQHENNEHLYIARFPS